MRIHAVLLAALTAAGTLAQPAVAAPKETCRLVADGPDVHAGVGPAVVHVPRPSLDIVSGDLVIGRTRKGVMATATIRLRDLGAPDPVGTGAREYDFTWGGPGSRDFSYVLQANVPVTGPASFVFGYVDRPVTGGASHLSPRPTALPAGGVVDPANDEVRIWASVSSLHRLRAPETLGVLDRGARQSGFVLLTLQSAGAAAATEEATFHTVVDEARADRKVGYVSGHPSCARNGE